MKLDTHIKHTHTSHASSTTWKQEPTRVIVVVAAASSPVIFTRSLALARLPTHTHTRHAITFVPLVFPPFATQLHSSFDSFDFPFTFQIHLSPSMIACACVRLKGKGNETKQKSTNPSFHLCQSFTAGDRSPAGTDSIIAPFCSCFPTE